MSRASRLDAILLLLLAAVGIAIFPQAALIVDSGRDLSWGWSIARGAEFPLTGPSLNGLWQPGPVWYWLLGMLLWATGSIGLTTFAIGVLAAAKIPLAWLLGRRLQGPALGLALAAAIALPGWSTLGQLVLSHTSLVETAVLATLWLSLRAWQERSRASVVVASLLLGLAVHAHPTALIAAPALGIAFLRARRGRIDVPLVAAGAAAFLLPFVPMLVAEAQAGWPQWRASTGYFGHSDYAARLLRLPRVLWGASGGEVAFVHALLHRWPAIAMASAIALGAVLALAALGLLRGWRQRPMWAALAFAAWCWGFVLLLRDSTPAWMVYACAPAGAALVALGWQRGFPRHEVGAARALAVLALALGGALLAERIATVRSGEQYLPGASVADIAAPSRNDPVARFWLPSWGHDAAARRLCSEDPAVAVHGDLATALNLGQGVAVELHCAGKSVALGGEASRHVVGVPQALATRLGLVGETTSWGYVLVPDAVPLAPRRGERIASHTRYLMDDYARDLAHRPVTASRAEGACAPGQLLVATNFLPQLNSPFELSADTALQARAETLASRYYDCPGPGFTIELQHRAPAAAEIFVLGSDALSASADAR